MDQDKRKRMLRRLLAAAVIIAVVALVVFMRFRDNNQLLFGYEEDVQYLAMDQSQLGEGVKCRFACYDPHEDMIQICLQIPRDYFNRDVDEILTFVDGEAVVDRTFVYDNVFFVSYVSLLLDEPGDWNEITLTYQGDTVVLTMPDTE